MPLYDYINEIISIMQLYNNSRRRLVIVIDEFDYIFKTNPDAGSWIVDFSEKFNEEKRKIAFVFVVKDN